VSTLEIVRTAIDMEGHGETSIISSHGLHVSVGNIMPSYLYLFHPVDLVIRT
jgi:hypothetical protein